MTMQNKDSERAKEAFAKLKQITLSEGWVQVVRTLPNGHVEVRSVKSPLKGK